MKRLLVPTLGVAGSLIALFSGCAAGQGIDNEGGGGAGAGGTTTTTSPCIPGKQEQCPCPGGTTGVQACNAQGTGFSACACGSGGTGGTGGSGGSDLCGDAFCVGEETCATCPSDCGTCAPCDIAPSCANAQIPPASMAHVAELDTKLMPMSKEQIAARLQDRVQKQAPGVRLVMAALSAPREGEAELVAALRDQLTMRPALAARLDHHLTAAGGRAMKLDTSDWSAPQKPLSGEFPGGTPECGAPLLRIRAATVTVHEEDDDFANDIVYCALTSEAASASEIRVKPQTPNLDEGDSHTYPIEAGVFWGQMAPETPGGNILLTYDCFEADTSGGYQSLLDGIGQAATAIGGVAGSYGWVFTVIGAVAPVIGDVVGMDGDDHLFNAQQTIPLDKQLDLTNGRFWSVRRHGSHSGSDWDWELRVEAWGCAEKGTL